jgi:hypothetical protein
VISAGSATSHRIDYLGSLLLAGAATCVVLLTSWGGTKYAWGLNAYFFILGLSLGFILQVLVIAVQNSADYADLGAATSGNTFFRTIGGAFGVAICGSIFSNRLRTELAAALTGVRLPRGFNPATAQSNPALLRTLPATIRPAVLAAYAHSVDPHLPVCRAGRRRRVRAVLVPAGGAAAQDGWCQRSG